MTPPSVLLETPLCAEVMGAGFQKLPASRLYELRFARLLKIHNPIERSWIHALDSHQLVTAAHQALGYIDSANPENVTSPADDSIRAAWRSSSTICLDIPELPTPTPSPERQSPRRMQSAPEIWKVSPPTPRREATGLFGSRRALKWPTGRDDGGPGLALRTSPIRATEVVKMPMEMARFKRARIEHADEYRELDERASAYVPMTPPPSSPVLGGNVHISPLFTPSRGVTQSRDPVRKRDRLYGKDEGGLGVLTPTKRRKALSLRSRIKLAWRGSSGKVGKA
jgi:hypothetical protein